MKKFIIFRFRELWVFTSAIGLVSPLYFILVGDQMAFWQYTGTIMLLIFLLSMPASLIGAPIVAFTRIALGGNAGGFIDTYLSLVLFIAFGAVQWFWIVPRYLNGTTDFQKLDLPDGTLAGFIERAKTGACFGKPDFRSPVVHVIRDGS